MKTSLNGTAMGTAELLSVPYALYAENGGTPGPAGPTGAQGPAGTPVQLAHKVLLVQPARKAFRSTGVEVLE
ncbi:MAG: hypothetical protein IPI91_16430 [Flavobacteriales bacterium]|nr:hypothetical protein [Flavobacteriales bacterium]